MVKEITFKLENIEPGQEGTECFVIRANKEKGISAYHAYIGENKNKKCGLYSYIIKNEEYNILSNDQLFVELDKIKYPKERHYFDENLKDVPKWVLEVDIKTYLGNTNPEFFEKTYKLLKIDEILKFLNSF